MNELALFAGAGGGILGGHLLGWRTVCAVEWEPYPASVLLARQNDGLLPPFPVWDDVQTFDGRLWRGIVDVISGGFPCQDISAAGKGAGIDGERSGMWREMARIIHEVRPRFVFVENSPMLTSRGLGTVLGDLAALGFDARWGVLGAADVGAPHRRDRIWIVANSKSIRHRKRGKSKNIFEENGRQDGQMRPVISGSSERFKNMAYSTQLQRNGINDNSRISMGRKQISEFGDCSWKKGMAYTKCFGSHSTQDKQVLGRSRQSELCSKQPRNYWCNWWSIEPNVGRMADGVAARVDRLKAIGNGQVSEVARRAWEILSDQR
jgi:DNA (cytosine-5)-methyltransferase 1